MRPPSAVVSAVAVAGLLAGCARPAPSLNDGPAPWPAPERPEERIAGADLAAYDEEGPLHFHTHLDVFVDGREVEVPGSLGLTRSATASLHTHSPSGILHIESADQSAQYTLADLFTLWGVRFTGGCVGSYCAPDTPIIVHVDGQPWPGSLEEVRLASFEQLTLVIGEPPTSVPARYDCRDAAPVERRSCQGFLEVD